MTFLHRYTLNSFILLLVVFLTACSSTRLIYSFADEFIKNEVTFFFNLDEKQKVLMNQQISNMVNWHRTTMMPKYASYLTDIANKIEVRQYDDIDISNLLANGRSLIENTVTGLTPYASKFLIRHQNLESIKYLKKKMENRRQERLAELSKPKNILYEKRLKQLTSNFERFLGDLSKQQITLIEDYAEVTLADSMIRLRNRAHRQKVFLEFIAAQPTEQELTDYLNKLILRGYTITNPNYQAFSDAWLKRFQALIMNMLAITSREQRIKVINKLREYSRDFNAISS